MNCVNSSARISQQGGRDSGISPLSLEHIREIVKIQISRFKERLTANGIGLQIDEAAEDLLAEKGYDPVYGARPIKRVIQKELETPISRFIISGEIKEGDTIRVSAEGDRISIKV